MLFLWSILIMRFFFWLMVTQQSQTLFFFCFPFYCTKWYSPQLECVIFDAFSPALCGRAIARSSLWRNIRCFVAFLVEEVANYLLLWLRVSFHYIQKMKKTFIKLSNMQICIRSIQFDILLLKNKKAQGYIYYLIW